MEVNMNLNKFYDRITIKEGLKKSISVAQVKEVGRLIFEEIWLMAHEQQKKYDSYSDIDICVRDISNEILMQYKKQFKKILKRLDK